jgi:hypothetical protein
MCNTLWTSARSIISSINPREQQELALEGCTYHTYQPTCIKSTRMSSKTCLKRGPHLSIYLPICLSINICTSIDRVFPGKRKPCWIDVFNNVINDSWLGEIQEIGTFPRYIWRQQISNNFNKQFNKRKSPPEISWDILGRNTCSCTKFSDHHVTPLTHLNANFQDHRIRDAWLSTCFVRQPSFSKVAS